MLILRVTLPLNVPVFDGANDVRFIGRAELDLNLIAPLGLRLLQ